MAPVSTDKARNNFARLVERKFYKDQHVLVKRNNKPFAWIVGEPFMQRLGQFVDYLIEHEPALADKLAISLDENIQAAIKWESREVRTGELLPIEDIVND